MAKAQAQAAASAAVTESQPGSLLDSILDTMPKAVERDQGQQMVRTLIEESLRGTVVWDKSVTNTINKAIAAIDIAMSTQLAAIMHAPEFLKLEGSWRGLHHLIDKSETCATLKIRVMNITKRELQKDLEKAIEFDQSQMFKKMYEEEFGSPGGEPYGTLVGDFEFSNHPEDIGILEKMSNIAAAGFCPFIAASSPKMFGFESFTELSKPRDLEKIFLSPDYIKWQSFRNSEDSRFVVLTMPRVLSRLPYGSLTKTIDEFNYEEGEIDAATGRCKPMKHEHFAWMNAAFVLAAQMTAAFSKTNWCTAIRGAENGGKVEGLPSFVFTSDDGDPDQKCPTEIGITDRRDAELSKLGFLALGHYKNSDYAVFFGAQTTQKPKKYDRPEATANAAISARLPYLMATGRIAHYLKCIARDKLGSFMERQDCEDWLNRWIHNYVLADEKPSPDMKAKYPLREARIEVKEIPGKPGAYNAIAWLRPWLQLEELNTSLRMVAQLPRQAGS